MAKKDEKDSILNKMQGPRVDPLRVGLHDSLSKLAMKARRLRAHGRAGNEIHLLRKSKGPR